MSKVYKMFYKFSCNKNNFYAKQTIFSDILQIHIKIKQSNRKFHNQKFSNIIYSNEILITVKNEFLEVYELLYCIKRANCINYKI